MPGINLGSHDLRLRQSVLIRWLLNVTSVYGEALFVVRFETSIRSREQQYWFPGSSENNAMETTIIIFCKMLTRYCQFVCWDWFLKRSIFCRRQFNSARDTFSILGDASLSLSLSILSPGFHEQIILYLKEGQQKRTCTYLTLKTFKLDLKSNHQINR